MTCACSHGSKFLSTSTHGICMVRHSCSPVLPACTHVCACACRVVSSRISPDGITCAALEPCVHQCSTLEDQPCDPYTIGTISKAVTVTLCAQRECKQNCMVLLKFTAKPSPQRAQLRVSPMCQTLRPADCMLDRLLHVQGSTTRLMLCS